MAITVIITNHPAVVACLLRWDTAGLHPGEGSGREINGVNTCGSAMERVLEIPVVLSLIEK